MTNPASLKGHPMAREITLETSDGELVATGRIPQFMSGSPPIITWGIRTFALHAIAKNREGPDIYRETFAVALVDVD